LYFSGGSNTTVGECKNTLLWTTLKVLFVAVAVVVKALMWFGSTLLTSPIRANSGLN